MARIRSPGYPNLSLRTALKQVERIFSENRRNMIDREAAAISIGYKGSSGASDKSIATLSHYGLIDKVGKGEIRVSQLAVDILHPTTSENWKEALRTAAFSPQIFSILKDRFPDDYFSEGALRSFLVREEFQDAAIAPVIKAYGDTCDFLKQENAFEESAISSVEASPNERQNADEDAQASWEEVQVEQGGKSPRGEAIASPVTIASLQKNERTVFVEEGDPGQYLKLIASGEIDDYLLEALEDFVKRQRRRLTRFGSISE